MSVLLCIFFLTLSMDNSEQNGGTMRALTFGEKAVGLTFNPSGDTDVQAVKEAFAKAIDLCNDLREKVGKGEQGRLLSIAITEAQGAQMWAVKGITWKE
jgi:hypothetical protein